MHECITCNYLTITYLSALVVTHNYCVRHSHSRDCTFKINSSGLRQFRFELMCEYHSFVWKWRVKLTRPISVSCLIIYILHNW